MRVKIILLYLFCFLFSGFSFVQAKINCLKCHPKIKKQLNGSSNIHQPLSQQNCTTCHNIHASDEPHLLVEPTKELCLSCHEKAFKRAFKVRYTHLPVMRGECDRCHDPHASPHKALLKSSESQICFGCHKKKEIIIGSHLHPALKKGCLVCHNAHGGKYPWLLGRPPEELCFGCHKRTEISRSHNAPAIKGTACLSCHNPHASKRSHLLRQFAHKPYAKKQCGKCHVLKGKEVKGIKIKDRSLCLKCHPMRKAEASIYSHIQASTGTNACLSCHSPHLSDKKFSLKAPVHQLCFNCHQETRTRILSNSPDYKYKHPGVRSGACLDCHSAHASNNLYFFKEDAVTVCANCHKGHAKFGHPLGKKAIDPRCKKEMDCVSCHDPMGTRNTRNTIFDYKKELCTQCHKIRT